MTPTSLFSVFTPRGAARAAAAFVMGLAAAESTSQVEGSTLSLIRDRGALLCGVDTGLRGFAAETEDGWTGFEADLCRAYAAAFLDDPGAVRFVPLTTAERFDALKEGRVDLLLRNTSWTFARDAALGVDFAGTYYFDGQGFLAPADLGVASARELDGARICVQSETTTALNIADYMSAYEVSFTLVERDTAAAALQAYAEGACDAFTNDISSLAGLRLDLDEPEAHALLPDVISKEPLGPVVSGDDAAFTEAVRWVLFALIAAEEYGVTAETARDDALELADRTPEVRRLLGAEGAIGAQAGLDAEFARRAIAARGHYGELFERHLGRGSDLGLRRGLNAQWTEGGLLYAPPFR